MNQTTFKQTKATDILAEAFTVISDLRIKAYEQKEMDVEQFLGTIETQINLYRVATIKGTK